MVVTAGDRDMFADIEERQGRLLKALIISPNSEALPSSVARSKANPEDPFGQYRAYRLLEPPYNPMILLKMIEYSVALSASIETMEVNIPGFGHRLVSIFPGEIPEAFKEEAASERLTLQNRFSSFPRGKSLRMLRRELRRDREGTGNAYMELIRNPSTGELVAAKRLKSYQIRLGQLSEKMIDYDLRTPYATAEGERDYMIVRDSKHFRTYLQVTSAYSEGDTTIHDARWFKEYRDPRVIDNTTGEVVPYSKQMDWDGSGNPMPEERKASEIYHFGGSDRSPYGIPRWASAIGSVLGARSGELVNLHTIQSNGVPSMMVTVSNGRLTEGTINRIQKYVDEHSKGSANYSTFLILEGEGDIAGDETNQVKISVTPMADAQVREMLFGTYIATNEARIMKAFRLSSIYLGDVAAFNKSTADVSRRLVEEQVFAPERDEDDWFFNDVLLAEWGVKHWRFVTNTPNITDNKDLIAMLVSAERTGGVTPRIARGIMAEVYPRLLESGDAKDPVGVELDTPFSLQIAKAVQSQANVVEPNQTGPPVMPPMDPSDAFKRLEKALFGVDELLEAEVRRYLTMSEDDAE